MITKIKQQNKIPKLRFPGFNGDWKKEKFVNVFKVTPNKKYQIKKSEISENGEYKVIDQGKNDFAGYSNEIKKLFKDYPVIIFGDHTTILKYINFEFIVGADGTKILKEEDNKRSNLRYLYYYLQLNNVNAEGYKRHFSILRNKIVKFPPLPEQQKIASFLGTVDEQIELLKKKREGLEKYKKGIMQKILCGHIRFIEFKQTKLKVREGYIVSKLGSFPIDWELKQLKDIVWFQEGPGVMTSQFTKAGVKLFNGTNIQKNKIILENTNTFISKEEAYGKYKHFLADSGDLVIACSGISVDKFDEKVAFVDNKHLPLCMNTSTMRFKSLDKDVLDINYFSYFIRTSIFKDQIRRQITGSAQLNFGPTHVGTFYMSLPSIKEQQKIASFLSAIDKKIELVDAQIQKMQDWKRGLMQGLFV